MFRVSYILAGFVGFVLTFGIGYIISLTLKLMKLQGKEVIYTDDTKTTINPALFLPPKAHYIRKRNLVFEQKAKEEIEFEKY